jgi:hypothetical protein
MMNRVFAALASALMPTARVQLPLAIPSHKGGKQHRVHKQARKKSKPSRSFVGPNHRGEKERERAARCYMEPHFPNGQLRPAPVMCQVSKRAFYGMVAAAEARTSEIDRVWIDELAQEA